MISVKEIIHTPGYPQLLTLRIFGSLSTWIDFTLIFSYIAFYWKAEANVVGITAAAYGVGGLVFGPLVGRLVDKSNPINAIKISFIGRILASALLAFTTNISFFIFFVFLRGLANLGATPAEQILTRYILRKEQFSGNIGFMSTIDQTIKIMAPIAGAAISLLNTPSLGFSLSVLLSIGGLISVSILHSRLNLDIKSEADKSNHNYMVGLATLLKENGRFRLCFLATVFQTAALSFYDPLLSFFLKSLGYSSSTFGIVVSCTAAGGILGALIFKASKLTENIRLIGLPLALFGSTVLIAGLLAIGNFSPSPYIFFFLWIFNGFFYNLTAMTFGVVMLAECPKNSLGRISTTVRSCQLGLLVVGPLIGSLLTTAIGVNFVLLICGLSVILFAIAMLFQAFSIYGDKAVSSN